MKAVSLWRPLKWYAKRPTKTMRAQRRPFDWLALTYFHLTKSDPFGILETKNRSFDPNLKVKVDPLVSTLHLSSTPLPFPIWTPELWAGVVYSCITRHRCGILGAITGLVITLVMSLKCGDVGRVVVGPAGAVTCMASWSLCEPDGWPFPAASSMTGGLMSE